MQSLKDGAVSLLIASPIVIVPWVCRVSVELWISARIWYRRQINTRYYGNPDPSRWQVWDHDITARRAVETPFEASFHSRSTAPTPHSTSDCAALLSLPTEIRLQILEYCATGYTFDVSLHPRKGLDRRGRWCASANAPRELLSMLLSCRQIYVETIPYLYSKNTFRMQTPPALACLLTTIPTDHCSSLREVDVIYPEETYVVEVSRGFYRDGHGLLFTFHLMGWQHMWAFFAKMLPSLRRLTVIVRCYYASRVLMKDGWEESAGWLIPVLQMPMPVYLSVSEGGQDGELVDVDGVKRAVAESYRYEAKQGQYDVHTESERQRATCSLLRERLGGVLLESLTEDSEDSE